MASARTVCVPRTSTPCHRRCWKSARRAVTTGATCPASPTAAGAATRYSSSVWRRCWAARKTATSTSTAAIWRNNARFRRPRSPLPVHVQSVRHFPFVRATAATRASHDDLHIRVTPVYSYVGVPRRRRARCDGAVRTKLGHCFTQTQTVFPLVAT